MLLKKINIKRIDKILDNDKWIFIDMNNIFNNNVKDKLTNEIINKLKNKKRYWLFLNNDEFIKWFSFNKDINKKYLLINNLFHCKYQYRFIRFHGYKSFLLKNNNKK